MVTHSKCAIPCWCIADVRNTKPPNECLVGSSKSCTCSAHCCKIKQSGSGLGIQVCALPLLSCDLSENKERGTACTGQPSSTQPWGAHFFPGTSSNPGEGSLFSYGLGQIKGTASRDGGTCCDTLARTTGPKLPTLPSRPETAANRTSPVTLNSCGEPLQTWLEAALGPSP